MKNEDRSGKTHYLWSDGKDAALDVTVTSPLASSNLAAAIARPGGTLDKEYDRKMRNTADTCLQQEPVFLPIAVETLGGMHHLAVSQLKRLNSALARHTGSYERQCSNDLQPPPRSRFPATRIGRD